jgi:CheY-like chemotaxis protein
MESPRPQSDRSPVRVLVVDDCEVNRLLACAMLARWGIAPVVASDGEEAVCLVRQQPFDLVLMDVDMPGLDGMLATEQIRRFEREQAAVTQVPVVAYTGCAFADESRLRESGMSDLLKKPCSASAMAECLLRHCAGKFVPTTD